MQIIFLDIKCYFCLPNTLNKAFYLLVYELIFLCAQIALKKSKEELNDNCLHKRRSKRQYLLPDIFPHVLQ